MPPITFIALQCFQCSTMQVKQQKKSSNKWSCVVCNQKQSVRKVFAQGFQAKDVRKFVQSFNMSRQLTEQTLIEPSEEIDESFEEHTVRNVDKKKRRNDWSGYLDPGDIAMDPNGESEVVEETEGGFEPKIVTELPKELFKKPKLKNYSPASGSNLFSPTFSRKTHKQPFNSQEVIGDKVFTQNGNSAEKMGPGKSRPKVMAQAPSSKWSDYLTPDEGDLLSAANGDSADAFSGKSQPKVKSTSSKWSDYLTTDEEDLLIGADGDLADPFKNSGVLENRFVDQRVEDYIHPDFL